MSFPFDSNSSSYHQARTGGDPRSLAQSLAAHGDSDSSQVADILADYLQQLETGETPDRARILSAYPDMADALEENFDKLDALHQAACGLSEGELRLPAQFNSPTEIDRQIGDFRILREIGRGGMGIVYEAEQISLKRRVAVKVLPLAGMLDKRALARFQNEARAAATLFHPNIVPVFFVGSERSVHFYAMQLIEGTSLAEVIGELRTKPETGMQKAEQSEDDPRVPFSTLGSNDTVAAALSTARDKNPRDYFRRVAEIGIQIAEGLQHAHESGILHRDIKPGNVLLDEEGKAWLTDFGLARIATDATLTGTGDFLGTLRYMSPEQVSGGPGTDVRSDVYSLGVTLYELTSLEPAFPQTEREQLATAISSTEPRRPTAHNASIPHELETIILKTIEKAPQDRYATAQELADDLRRYLQHEPIRARRPSLRARAAKWTTRHRSVVATAVTTLLIALTVSMLLITQAYRSEKLQRRDAEQARQQAEASLVFSREIMDDLYLDLATTWIADETAPSSLQQDFLARASQFYQQLAARPAKSREDQQQVALAHTRIGQIAYYLDNIAAAGAALQWSVNNQRQLLEQDPSDAELRSELANALQLLGSTFAELGRIEYAEEAFRSCRGHYQKLSETFPNEDEHSLALVDIDLELARILILQSELTEAETLLAQTVGATKAIPPVSTLLDIKRAYVSIELLQAQGDFEPALKECHDALDKCRRYVNLYFGGNQPISELETQLVEKLGELEAATGNLDDAIATNQSALQRRQDSLKAKLRPIDFVLRTWFIPEISFDKQFEPGPFCSYVETQLQAALVLSRANRRYEAERHFGEALAATSFLVSEKPDSLRYRVVEASTWGIIAKVFSEYRPQEALEAQHYAGELWQDVLATFPQAGHFRSGVLGHTTDYDWFVKEVRPSNSDTAQPQGERIWLVWHALARASYDNGQFEEARKSFQTSADDRKSDWAYDWFYIAMCHAQLGHPQRARSWFNKSMEQMERTENPHRDLVELRAKAKRLLDDKASTEELVSHEGHLVPKPPTRYQFAEQLVAPDAHGLAASRKVRVGPEGNLYVASRDSDDVKVFHAETGALIRRLHTPGGELDDPWEIEFGPDGQLYVSGVTSNNIIRFDTATGNYEVFVSADQNGGMRRNRGIAFGPDGRLYATSRGAASTNALTEEDQAILRFDGATGQFLDIFVPSESGGLKNPTELTFGLDGHLYVASTLTHCIKVYDGETGKYLRDFIHPQEAGLRSPTNLEFREDGYLYVASKGTQEVLRFAASTGVYVDTLIPVAKDKTRLANVVAGFAFDQGGRLFISCGTPTGQPGSRILRYSPRKAERARRDE